ncbi:MAG: helix-turn-helix domain-containing protein [Paludibaculum sp.]
MLVICQQVYDELLSGAGAKAKLNWASKPAPPFIPAFRERVAGHRFQEGRMSNESVHTCTNCGEPAEPALARYRYVESGISNLYLQGVKVAECHHCGESDVIIPRIEKIHRAIALALANSPARLTGKQLRFLRKHLGLNGEQLGRYLHTDKTKISKWESGEDRIGPSTDRLIRLLVAALDSELRPGVSAVAEHLPQILDESGKVWELQVDVTTLQSTFVSISRAA